MQDNLLDALAALGDLGLSPFLADLDLASERIAGNYYTEQFKVAEQFKAIRYADLKLVSEMKKAVYRPAYIGDISGKTILAYKLGRNEEACKPCPQTGNYSA